MVSSEWLRAVGGAGERKCSPRAAGVSLPAAGAAPGWQHGAGTAELLPQVRGARALKPCPCEGAGSSPKASCAATRLLRGLAGKGRDGTWANAAEGRKEEWD